MALSPSFRTARWIRTTNLILQAGLVLSLFAMLNYLALHYAWRFDLTRMRAHSLSAETRAHLKALKQPVHIYVTIAPDSEAYHRVRSLLREYAYTTESKDQGRVTVEYIDPDRNPRKLRELQLDLEQYQGAVALVTSQQGTRRESRMLAATDLFQAGRKNPRTGKPDGLAFSGEHAFTSAILDVTGSEQKKIYFLVSHGEMELTDTRPSRGLSVLKDQLSFRNYKLEPLNFSTARAIPDDAALLVCAAPQSPFTKYELVMLREYMTARDGHFLYLSNDRPTEETGLNDLWHDWGIIVDRAAIMDSNPEYVRENGDLIFKVFDGEHPVTRQLPLIPDQVTFGQTTVVRPNPSKVRDEGLVITRLIVTQSPTAWGERDFRDLGRARYNPGQDLPPDDKLLVAAIASERVSAKKNLPFSVHGGRLVVFGSAQFIANNRIALNGNLNLITSAIDWLAERDGAVNVPARPIEQFQLSLTEKEQSRLQYSLLFGVPGAVAILGLLVYWTRRR